MAKLSDFQRPATSVAFVVDQKRMDRNAKAAASSVNWRNTPILETDGARETNPFRRTGFVDKRQRMHDALDVVISNVERKRDSSSEEPEEDFQSELQEKLRGLLRGSDEDSRAAKVISPTLHKVKVSHTSGYVNDAAFIAQHLDPNMLCVEAENALHDVSLKRQVDDCKRSYWNGLFYFLHDQPKGSRIRDIKNQVCLSTLLMHTLGGTKGAFGAY